NDFVALGANPATTGFLRVPSGAQTIIACTVSNALFAVEAGQNTVVSAASTGPTSGVVLRSGISAGSVIAPIAFQFNGTTDSVTFLGASTEVGLGHLQWSSAITPVLTQASTSAVVQGTNFNFTAQQSTHATNNGGGSFFFSVQVPAGSGVESGIQLSRGENLYAQLGPSVDTFTGGTGTVYSCLYLGPSIAPNALTNFAIAGDTT